MALSACVGVSPVVAQPQQSGSSSSFFGSRTVTVEGQIYLPDGAPLQQSIRCQLISGDGVRPPDDFFTDSGGRFTLRRVHPLGTYYVVVKANGRFWGATRAAIYVPDGRHSTVYVQLSPPERMPVPDGNTVSAAALRERVPKDARKQFEMARKWIDQGNRKKAHPMLLRAVKIYPDYVEAHNELAVELMKAGQLMDAEQHLRRALESDPEAVLPNLNLGLCLQRQERFTEARSYLEEAVRLRPDQPESLLLLGIEYIDLRREKEAEPLLIRAYELGGAEVARANLLLAQIYSWRKEYGRSAATLETYLRDVPNAPDSPHLLQILDKLRLRAAGSRP